MYKALQREIRTVFSPMLLFLEVKQLHPHKTSIENSKIFVNRKVRIECHMIVHDMSKNWNHVRCHLRLKSSPTLQEDENLHQGNTPSTSRRNGPCYWASGSQ